MATVEQLAEALRVLAEQQGALQQYLAQLTQTSTVMMAEIAKPKGERTWNDMMNFKNVRMFTGELKEWEEFAEKFKGQVAAGNVKVAEVLDFVEAKMAEDELEEDDYATMVDVDDMDEDKVTEVGTRYTICS